MTYPPRISVWKQDLELLVNVGEHDVTACHDWADGDLHEKFTNYLSQEEHKAEVSRLKGALEFYAKMRTNNYEAEGDGTVARKALKETV